MQSSEILKRLRACPGIPLADLPSSSGIYALRDHLGALSYLGLAHSEGFRVRVRNKHATGSEDRSHKFSCAYNSGRLWRDRHNGDKQDGSIAKRLRNQFILKHCSASFVEVPDYGSKADLELIERGVIALASPAETIWNGKFTAADEPTELVGQLIEELRLSHDDVAAINRQKQRYLESKQ